MAALGYGTSVGRERQVDGAQALKESSAVPQGYFKTILSAPTRILDGNSESASPLLKQSNQITERKNKTQNLHVHPDVSECCCWMLDALSHGLSIDYHRRLSGTARASDRVVTFSRTEPSSTVTFKPPMSLSFSHLKKNK